MSTHDPSLRGEGNIIGPKWPIAFVAMTAAFIAVLDVAIVNVALPSIRASLGASLQDTSWIATGYIVSNVIVIPMTGFFQRRIGYRNYFAGSLALFTLASALCAFSWNLPSLVLFRMLQGLGGGALIPTASGIMLDRFPKRERSMAMALFGMGAMAGPMLGPSLGGFLTDQFSWHMIFLINVPVGIVEIFAILSLVREDRSDASRPAVDWWGISFLAGWLATLQYVLEEGNADGWFDSPLIVGLSAASVACLGLFVWHELRATNPVVNLRVFRDRQYATGTLINMGVGLVLFGGVYLFSLFCGVIMGYTASQTGHLSFFAALVQLLLMPIIGKVGPRFDPRLLVGAGVALMGLSLLQYAHLTGQESSWQLLYPQMLRAAGMSLVFIPVNTLSLDRIAPAEMANAAGLFNLTRELGGSIGTATLATVITRRAAFHSSRLSEVIDPFSAAAQERLASMTAALTAKLGDPARAAEAALASLKGVVAKQSLILAFADGFALATCAIGVMVVVVLTMKKPTGAAADVAAH